MLLELLDWVVWIERSPLNSTLIQPVFWRFNHHATKKAVSMRWPSIIFTLIIYYTILYLFYALPTIPCEVRHCSTTETKVVTMPCHNRTSNRWNRHTYCTLVGVLERQQGTNQQYPIVELWQLCSHPNWLSWARNLLLSNK